jgi:hypothetical protein
MDGDDSPQFPALRLFRQSSFGGGQPAIEAVAAAYGAQFGS